MNQSISNLSIGLIESAFLLLAKDSLRVYRHNIQHERPPVAHGENVNAAASIVMLITGLDYHLCRLNYLRDVAVHKAALPHTPYFEWKFGDPLSTKLKKLLTGRNETRLLSQLIVLTVCRDCVVHPKFYTITESMNYRKLRARLAPGATLGNKALRYKMGRKNLTKLLKLPLVPTWISYVDAVMCILVVHRLLNLLEKRYGNPYAWVGGITAYEKQTKELFTGWNWQNRHPRELEDWAKAFYQSLSPLDQGKVKKALAGRLDDYLKKKQQVVKLPRGRHSLSDILRARRNQPKPEFLYKPPPRKT